jgi:hypothetical protein
VEDMTRAGFMKSSAAAVAGASALGAIAAAAAQADEHPGNEPVVAYVKNPSKGEIAVMSGEREVVVRDRKLARQLARQVR